MKLARTLLALAPLPLLAAAPADKVDPERLSSITKTLASDAFEGRAPGSAGEKKTIAYLIEQLKAAGAEPGGPNGHWTQAVPLIHTRIDPKGTMALTTADGTRVPIAQGVETSVTTVRPIDRVAIAKAPLVFVGYGVTAPEAKWDDFKGQDLKGKVAVFLINDPDFEAQAGEDAKGRFGDRRMTYYGRWTYKFEEAARRGAIAAFIVHDTAGVGYPWSTLVANNGENYDIVRADDDYRIPLQGWLAHDFADSLFRRAGLDLDALRVQARSESFKPVPMNVTLDTSLPVTVEKIESANVFGRIPGKRFPNENVMFAAHWDAYGIGPADAQGRTIRPGANDDALGVAGVIELARVFAKRPRPDRSMVFAFWTAEERVLLGSEHYAVNPVWPLATTVANMTLDIMETAGPAKDVILVGEGKSTLEDDLALAAKAQGRTITPETFSERGLYFRADHFSVARRGVPAIQIMALGGASDLVNGGRAAGQKWLDDYNLCYHKPCEMWEASWDLRGAAQDVDLFAAMGGKLANSRIWLERRPGAEFAGLREETKDQLMVSTN